MRVEERTARWRGALQDSLKRVNLATKASRDAVGMLLHRMNEVLRTADSSSFGRECSDAIDVLYETIGRAEDEMVNQSDDLTPLYFARSFAVVLEEAVRQLQLLRQKTTTVPPLTSGEASLCEATRVEKAVKEEPAEPERRIEVPAATATDVSAAPTTNDEKEEHGMERRGRRGRRVRRKKKEGEGDRGDSRDWDRNREGSEHMGKDKKKKRKRSRSHRDRSREREGDRKRRKMGLPSHPKEGTTTIASCTVWLGGLPQINLDELRSSISQLSSAKQVELMHTHSCAYVTMRDRRAAVKLLEKTNGTRVKDKEIEASWTAGNGAVDEQWRPYWDEERGISSIPHNKLPLDAMNDLCVGGWLDVSTLPIHLRGIIDDAGKVIEQSSSGTSLLDEATSRSSSLHDLGQFQRPPPLLDLAIPNPLPHFNSNMNPNGVASMPPPMWMGSSPFFGQGIPNGPPPLMRAPLPPPPVLFQMIHDLWSESNMPGPRPPPPVLFQMLRELWMAWSMAG